MKVRITRNQSVDVPMTLRWTIPYLRRAADSGWRLPEKIYFRNPAYNRNVNKVASSEMYPTPGNYKVIPESYVFMHTGDGNRRFYRPTILKHLAHEIAHIQNVDNMSHKESWAADSNFLTEDFMLQYEERKA